MGNKTNYYIRRTHRWLGVLIGIQFMAWTLGGLYFSWSDMDEVHGDYERAPVPALPVEDTLCWPAEALANIRKQDSTQRIASVKLINLLGKPVWQIIGEHRTAGHGAHRMPHLVDARTGVLRGPLSKEEAVAVAEQSFRGKPTVAGVEYLTETNGHHEYREQALPAYAIRFNDARATVAYVSTGLGTVEKFRNRPWRIFDFLWMLHTMDYNSRDNLGNWLLRAFSIFGLATVCSGFLLFFVSRRKGQKVGRGP
jgi:hypothetical protein